jgi:hypothetical protein
MIAGRFRFVCCNGMVCGETYEDMRVQHKGNIVHDVIDAAYTVVENFARIDGAVDQMKALTVRTDEAEAFADAALAVRYFNPETGTVDSPIHARQVLASRRHEDSRPDVWTTFQRVQENMTQGGLHGTIRAANGQRRRTSTRAVNGIDGNVSLNRALWTLAEKMAQIKAAH